LLFKVFKDKKKEDLSKFLDNETYFGR